MELSIIFKGTVHPQMNILPSFRLLTLILFQIIIHFFLAVKMQWMVTETASLLCDRKSHRSGTK